MMYLCNFDVYRFGLKFGQVHFVEGKCTFKAELDLPFNIEDDVVFAQLEALFASVEKHKPQFTIDDDLIFGNFHYSFAGYKSKEKKIARWVDRQANDAIDLIVEDNCIVACIFPSRTSTTIFVASEYEHYTPVAMWQDAALLGSDFNLCAPLDEKIEMKDGVLLATSIWLPESKTGQSPASFPTVLLRTPYGRNNFLASHFHFVLRGYALVLQDVRGREDSEGDYRPYVAEREDGDATLTWIASQSWSNEKVGMIGASYSGSVQWAAAASGNPYLKAINSVVAAGSGFGDLPRRGGTFFSSALAMSFAMSKRKIDRSLMKDIDWPEVLKERPLLGIPQKYLGRDVPFLHEMLENEEENAFWDSRNWSLHGEKINVPALLISGWYDDNGEGTIEAWELNKKYSRNNIRLILGPWLHKLNSKRSINGIDQGVNALRYDLDLQQLQWFERFLKGVENGIENRAKVEYYNLGKQAWENARNWPPEDIEKKQFYFNQGLSLTKEKSLQKQSWSYVFDPQNAPPHIIDITENELTPPGNYNKIILRDDVLSFTTEPLTAKLAIAGYPALELHASSTGCDTDWIVRLLRIMPNGDALSLSQGILRAKFRNSFRKAELLEPNTIYTFQIKMTRIACEMQVGERIALAVTSGAENQIFPNHNTGRHLATDTEFITVTQQIISESSLILPCRN